MATGNSDYPTTPDDDDCSIEDDLHLLDKLNVDYDFSAWESFRSSLSLEKRASMRRSIRATLLVPFPSTSAIEAATDDEGVDSDDDYTEGDSASWTNNIVTAKEEDAPVVNSLELTDEERYEIAAWRMRLLVGSVFGRGYFPQRWERNEMERIIEFLALKNPTDHPEYLDDPEQQVTKKAIGSIFFPEPGKAQSVLLKRGPVLVGGDKERELMIFTNGFVLSRVELDTLVNILLDANDRTSQDITSEQLCQRFDEIDSDHSRSLDRYELFALFQGTGMPLSEDSLDLLMKHFDSNSDGSIDLNEFKSMLCKLNKPKAQAQAQSSRLWSLGKMLCKALGKDSVTRKLDVAFQMSDIERIEKIDICNGSDFGSEWSKLTFALYLKGGHKPLVLTCAKPGHVEPWMEAFRTCLTGLKSRLPPKLPSAAQPAEVNDADHSGLICGVPTPEEKLRKKRISLEVWRESSVDWGLDESNTDD